jgi:hypothetical protein
MSILDFEARMTGLPDLAQSSGLIPIAYANVLAYHYKVLPHNSKPLEISQIAPIPIDRFKSVLNLLSGCAGASDGLKIVCASFPTLEKAPDFIILILALMGPTSNIPGVRLPLFPVLTFYFWYVVVFVAGAPRACLAPRRFLP